MGVCTSVCVLVCTRVHVLAHICIYGRGGEQASLDVNESKEFGGCCMWWSGLQKVR